MILCDKCGNRYPGYYIINTSNETEGYEQLCFECFNKIMADQLGIKLIELRKKSFTMDDIDGEEHLFKIIRKVYPQGIILEANEIQDEQTKGYVIAVDDNIDCNQPELEIKLYKKVKDELYNNYIESKNAFGAQHIFIIKRPATIMAGHFLLLKLYLL